MVCKPISGIDSLPQKRFNISLCAQFLLEANIPFTVQLLRNISKVCAQASLLCASATLDIFEFVNFNNLFKLDNLN